MADESPAANPPDDTPPAKRGRLLATRGRKIAAIVGAAFLATIGGILATSLLDLGKSTGKKVLGGSQAPLTVKILPRDSLEDTMVVLPYYVVPKGELPGPDAVGKSDLRSMGANTAESKNWAAEHHAVDGSPQVVNLELRARSDEPFQPRRSARSLTTRRLRSGPPRTGRRRSRWTTFWLLTNPTSPPPV